ncbi:MAG: aspartate aminotransferase family protein [Deltaproteobacteria bacterium]|nr:aspartate aminotransferase family protein [Deltaproteobacteria bacterium]
MGDKTADAEAIEAADKKYVMRPWPHPAGEPVIVARAKGCVVTDVHGKDYLDFTAGYFVNNAGHCHPRIAEAASKQVTEVLQVSGKHGTIPMVRLAERLMKLAPKPISKAFFSTGGSEANEIALKLARQYTKKPDIAYLENGYHGLTLGALEVTASEKYRESAGKPMGTENFAIPTAYCYRCKFGPHAECNVQCLDGVEEKLASRQTAAIIAEPIQAVGGLAPPQKWWDRLDQMRRKLGILLIADEIQTGLGRTGKMFAVEHYGLAPDIMTGGKGLCGGVGSLGLTSASDEVCRGFFGGTTPTNGGNAVSSAAGLALIDILYDEGLIENSAKMGRYFTEAAWAMKDPWIGDVRFTGLLGGIELVKNRDTKEVLGKAEIARVKDLLHEAGMLITVSGWHGNVLRLQPPLSVTSAQLDQFIAALRKTLTTVRGG